MNIVGLGSRRSIELCDGTQALSTYLIGVFKHHQSISFLRQPERGQTRRTETKCSHLDLLEIILWLLCASGLPRMKVVATSCVDLGTPASQATKSSFA